MKGTRRSLPPALALAVAAIALQSSDALAQNRQPGTPGSGQGGGQQQQVQQQRQAERSINQQQSQDHDRLQQRERDRTQSQASRAEVQPGATGIYGGNLMTKQERDQYREQRQMLKSDEERAQFELRHRERMQARGKERGADPVVTEN